jgi:hypothetical protein
MASGVSDVMGFGVRAVLDRNPKKEKNATGLDKNSFIEGRTAKSEESLLPHA